MSQVDGIIGQMNAPARLSPPGAGRLLGVDMPKRRGVNARIAIPQRRHTPVSALLAKDPPAEVRYVPASLMIGLLDPKGEGKWKRCPSCHKFHTKERFCSQVCCHRYWAKLNNAKRRAQKKGAAILEMIELGLVAERDGWRCHICKGKVAVDEASVDHLIPLSKGGDHSWENVALAHKRCNSRRGAGLLSAQLRLLG